MPPNPQGRDFAVRSASRQFTRRLSLSHTNRLRRGWDIARCHLHIQPPGPLRLFPTNAHEEAEEQEMASRDLPYFIVFVQVLCFAPNAGIERQPKLVSFPSHWFCDLCNPQIEVEAIHPFHSAFRPPSPALLSSPAFAMHLLPMMPMPLGSLAVACSPESHTSPLYDNPPSTRRTGGDLDPSQYPLTSISSPAEENYTSSFSQSLSPNMGLFLACPGASILSRNSGGIVGMYLRSLSRLIPPKPAP